jgi:hypothetical protein
MVHGVKDREFYVIYVGKHVTGQDMFNAGLGHEVLIGAATHYRTQQEAEVVASHLTGEARVMALPGRPPRKRSKRAGGPRWKAPTTRRPTEEELTALERWMVDERGNARVCRITAKSEECANDDVKAHFQHCSRDGQAFANVLLVVLRYFNHPGLPEPLDLDKEGI